MISESVRNLIVKYQGAGPRYTSYPTAVHLTEKFLAPDWKVALERDLVSREGLIPLSLYVHIPFCHELCYFCACSKMIPKSREVVAPYLAALTREAGLYADLISQLNRGVPSVRQLHFGGGSPNYLTPQELRELVTTLRGLFPWDTNDADISIELDPRTTTDDQVATLRELGFNRVSMGVQDFDPLVQTTINRIQSFEATEKLCAAVRSQGFSGLNVDLVYGLPNQTAEGFARTLEQVITLRPDRIALYGYAHVTWIKKVQKVFERAHLPSPDERLSLLTFGIETLERAGYVHLGMDHFALPTDRLAQAAAAKTMHRNFMGYTTHSGLALLALGASSISGTEGAFAQNHREVEPYLAALDRNQLPIARGKGRSRDDKIRGDIIQRILCDGMVDLEYVGRLWNTDLMEYLATEWNDLTRFEEDGILIRDGATVRLTELGHLFMRNVAMVFDAYLRAEARVTTSSQVQPRYSQTV